MKILIRIVESMIKNDTESKTGLAQKTNLNYARLAKHIVWLENKGFVESIIKNSKINIVLTQKGKLFALSILD